MLIIRRTASLSLFLVGSQLSAQAAVPVARIDSVFAAYNRTNGPGCAVGIYRDGQVAFTRGYGMADLNQGIAITPQTVFYIASTSKQFAAASLQLLVAQGKVALSDPLRRYVPELGEYANGVTLYHVLHHLSGIRDYLGLWMLSGRSPGDEIPEEGALSLIARQQALDFAPGSKWAYSNSNYFLISVVVKRVSGMSLRDFARANIFEPLGMRNTHFHDDRNQVVGRRAEGYEPNGKGGFQIVRTSFALVGDGGLYTTVEDLAKWDENFFSNRLAGGGPAFIQRLTTRGVLTSGDTTDYASGLMVGPYLGQSTVSHGGSFIGYRAELLRFPTLHTSVSVLCNDYTAPAEGLARQVAGAFLGSALGSPTAASGAPAASVAVDTATLNRYVGRYEFLPAVAGSIERNGAGIVASLLGMKAPLVARNDSTFTTDVLPGTFTFRRLADGRTGLFAPALGMDVPAAPLRPAPVLTQGERQAIVGSYASDELLTTFVVKESDGRLQVRAGWGPWSPMVPFQPGEFSVGNSKLAVERDKAGRVTGMRLDAGRSHGIKMSRLPDTTLSRSR